MNRVEYVRVEPWLKDEEETALVREIPGVLDDGMVLAWCGHRWNEHGYLKEDMLRLAHCRICQELPPLSKWGLGSYEIRIVSQTKKNYAAAQVEAQNSIYVIETDIARGGSADGVDDLPRRYCSYEHDLTELGIRDESYVAWKLRQQRFIDRLQGKKTLDPTTTLYRFFEDGGILLYVGISESAIQRMAQHSADKAWWSEVATVSIEHYSTRPDAMAAEKSAIQSERPLYNIVHNQ